MKTLIGLLLAAICIISAPLKAEALNKAELIDAISRDAKLTKYDSTKAVNAFIERVRITLQRGGTVDIVGLGIFSVETGPTGRMVRFQPAADLPGNLSTLPPEKPDSKVTQESCNIVLSPSSMTVNSGQGTGSIQVRASSSCAWIARSKSDWISIGAGQNGMGNGNITYIYQANPEASERTGYVEIAGKNYMVKQKSKITSSGKRPYL